MIFEQVYTDIKYIHFVQSIAFAYALGSLKIALGIGTPLCKFLDPSLVPLPRYIDNDVLRTSSGFGVVIKAVCKRSAITVNTIYYNNSALILLRSEEPVTLYIDIMNAEIIRKYLIIK